MATVEHTPWSVASTAKRGRARRARISLGRMPRSLFIAVAVIGWVLSGAAFAADNTGRWTSQRTPANPERAYATCPFSTADRPAPTRVVLQIIADVFHKWEEHDLPDAETCIVQVAPETRALTAGNARALIDASARWIEQPALPGVAVEIAPEDLPHREPMSPPAFSPERLERSLEANPALLAPDTPASPQYPAGRPGSGADGFGEWHDTVHVSPEKVIGDDDRVPVRDTEYHPWWVHGLLDVQGTSGGGRCTAFLVSPHTALTNGHCVYNAALGGDSHAKSITLAPGQYETAGGSVIRPYSSHSAVQWQTTQEYIDIVNDPFAWWSDEFTVDYAAVHFNTSFSDLGITTYMPLVFNQEPTFIDIVGYPGMAQDVATSGMWWSWGAIHDVLTRRLNYVADTSPGTSGAAVWELHSNYPVIAIHAYGHPYLAVNGGPRLVSQNQALIQGWMTWAPPSGPSNDDFAHAASITGGSGSTVGTNVGATLEPSEPDHCGYPGGTSVWWVWSPPSSGEATIDTAGSAFDVLLGVYTGSTVSNLTLVACDGSWGTDNSVSFAAQNGNQYYIAVDGYAGESGPVQLNWSLAAGPGADPTPPTNVTATAISHERIDLTWTHASSGADQYRIEFRQGSCSGTFAPLEQVDGAVTSYAHRDLTPESSYCYRIATVLGETSSAPSSSALASTLAAPAPPEVDSRVVPTSSDCAGTAVGVQCMLRIDLLDNDAPYAGIGLTLQNPSFSIEGTVATGIATGCLADAGPSLVALICTSSFSGSGPVLEVTVTRQAPGDSTFLTSQVSLVDIDGVSFAAGGGELFVPEFSCDVAHYADHPLGDINADGNVGVPDALLILQTAVAALPAPAPGSYESYHGDLDSDGVIGVPDALLALRKAVDPTRAAQLAVAPRSLTLALGQSACVLVGNAGSLPLPELSVSTPPGMSVTDMTHDGAVGRVLQVTRTSGTGGAVTISAGEAGSLTLTVNP